VVTFKNKIFLKGIFPKEKFYKADDTLKKSLNLLEITPAQLSDFLEIQTSITTFKDIREGLFKEDKPEKDS
jgi:hypothetical protein